MMSRCVFRFLYRHLLMFYSKTANLTEKSVFQQNSGSGLLILKSDVTLHLYVNQLPKGAAQVQSKLWVSAASQCHCCLSFKFCSSALYSILFSGV